MIFGCVKFKMPIGQPSGTVDWAVGYTYIYNIYICTHIYNAMEYVLCPGGKKKMFQGERVMLFKPSERLRIKILTIRAMDVINDLDKRTFYAVKSMKI